MERFIPEAAEEFDGADLGDERLNRRLMRDASCVATAPAAGFPRASGSDGELEGIYRFFRNERVTPAKILRPHLDNTIARAKDQLVLVAHDTTELAFGGSSLRAGLGRINVSGQRQGFFAHVALAVAGDGSRRPLGMVGLQTMVRGEKATAHLRHKRRSRVSEMARWPELALRVAESLPSAIHLMDREADSYEVISSLVGANARFVVRVCRDRVLLDGAERNPKLFKTADQGVILARRTVPLSRRRKHHHPRIRRIHPPRDERLANLQIRATSVPIKRPDRLKKWGLLDDQPSLAVNIVTVEEVDAPEGATPVSWRLVTTEPISTPAQVEAVVDHYRARWVIEELFKALKTGCHFEKRQLESFRALVNALAVFLVIAWRLLLLRSTARLEPEAHAEKALSARQVTVLRAIAKMKHPNAPRIDALPEQASARDALLAVAQMGGHLKSNGDPGWQVLGRGYESLLLVELGWIAREQM